MSLFAAQLLATPQPRVVADVLWEHLDACAPEQLATGPSAEVACMLAKRGADPAVLGAALDRPDIIDKVVRHRKLAPLWAAVATNPYLDPTTAAWMAPRAAQEAARLLELRADTIMRAAKEVPVRAAGMLAGVRAGVELAAHVAAGDPVGQAAPAVVARDVELRNAVVALLRHTGSDVHADRMCEQLLDPDGAPATGVDVELARWLVEADGAAMARALVLPDGQDGALHTKHVAERLSEDAAWWLVSRSDPQVDGLVERSKTAAGRMVSWRERRGGSAVKSTPTARRQGSAVAGHGAKVLAALGMDATRAAQIVLSAESSGPRSEVLELLDGCDPETVGGWLCGGYQDQPRPGEATRVLAARSNHDRDRIRITIGRVRGGDATPTRWDYEAAVQLAAADGPWELATRWAVADHLGRELGQNAAAWQVAVGLARGWEGSVPSLATSALELART